MFSASLCARAPLSSQTRRPSASGQLANGKFVERWAVVREVALPGQEGPDDQPINDWVAQAS